MIFWRSRSIDYRPLKLRSQPQTDECEGDTATSRSNFSVKLKLRAGGFTPRYLDLYADVSGRDRPIFQEIGRNFPYNITIATN